MSAAPKQDFYKEKLRLVNGDQSEELWTMECAAPCGFKSQGWATKGLAEARGKEHANEHETGELMTEIVEFEKQHTST